MDSEIEPNKRDLHTPGHTPRKYGAYTEHTKIHTPIKTYIYGYF